MTTQICLIIWSQNTYTEQKKQIKPPETPNSYYCEDREKMATAGSAIPRALVQRGCFGQHKS